MKEYVKSEDNKVYITQTENVAPVLDAIKDRQADYKHLSRFRNNRYVGSIPSTLANTWSQECGAAPGTAEFLEYTKKKLQSGDYSKLIVEGY